ncbi:LysR family transcriptional regulator [Curtobacterium sp. USHLN213]|uniref:LysR family transcriptional regulator n=1 Tax=Curtobacterium sp. USHLN213 TaxID=3081255 RepID=UPI0030167E22
MIEIKHLRLLRAVAAEGTLSAAARVLGYSQPAVTQQLQALERSIGTPVLLRGGSGIRLTPVGELLLNHGRSVLDTIDLATVEIEAMRSMASGTVRIAAFPSAVATIVPEAMRRLRDRHPGMSFLITEATPVEALDLLATGGCDVAVVFQYSSEPRIESDGLVRQPLLNENVHLAFGPDDPRSDRSVRRLEDFRDATWIAGCPKCSGNIIATCHAAGFEPAIGFETDDYVAVQSLALNGFGVSLIPDLILSIIRLPGLRLARTEPAQTRLVEAVSSPGLMMTPGIAETIAELRTAARDFVGRQMSAPAEPSAGSDVR